MKRISFISLFILLVATCLSAVTVSYDFNDTKDLLICPQRGMSPILPLVAWETQVP